MTQVIIIGAGGHGQVVADILLTGLQRGPGQANPIGFVDDDLSLQQKSFLNIPVLGTLADLPTIDHEAVIIAIGHNRTRHEVGQKLRRAGEQFITAIHPTAVIGAEVKIEAGAMICANVVINTGSYIGRDVILNTACTVDHHNRVAACAHVGPGAHLGGNVTIGEGALVGLGTSVGPGRSVGAWSTLGAGAVLISDSPARSTMAGVPARSIKNQKKQAGQKL